MDTKRRLAPRPFPPSKFLCSMQKYEGGRLGGQFYHVIDILSGVPDHLKPYLVVSAPSTGVSNVREAKKKRTTSEPSGLKHGSIVQSNYSSLCVAICIILQQPLVTYSSLLQPAGMTN